MTSADVGRLDRPTRLIEAITAIKTVRPRISAICSFIINPMS